MFLKELTIENEKKPIRKIQFFKGLNLIIDKTTENKKESGNNVGKTTVLRLIDFCLGGEGKNIYQDTEFKKGSNAKIEQFLKENNIIVTLVLNNSLENNNSPDIILKRNFLSRTKKIQEINSQFFNDKEYGKKLKELIFHSTHQKPSFRQIISRSIRDEKNKLLNTIKVLHSTVTHEEYEALYLFWLGLDIDKSGRKHQLFSQKKIEENLQKRLHKESNISQIIQSLLIIDRTIKELNQRKSSLNLSHYEEDFLLLNKIKLEINKHSTKLSRLELRKDLIIESKKDLEKEFSNIDKAHVKKLYLEAKSLLPEIQKTFEETLDFHNKMVYEKLNYITQELPVLEIELGDLKSTIDTLLNNEKILSEKLEKTGTLEDLEKIIIELNNNFEAKGKLEEQKRLWESSQSTLTSIEKELVEIDTEINSKDAVIQERIMIFNRFFSNISSQLYSEQFVLSSDKNEKGYELNIGSISGNLGTGKKKGQIAAFDLAYIQFADEIGLDCLHFVLHDQIENIHDNQISSLLMDVVSKINCQYILPVLKDKLPNDIDVSQYEILSLSQQDKLFKLD